MRCSEVREQLWEVVTGEGVPELKAHLSACTACASELETMQKTMALLDEWKAPEDTSTYFMTRLRARIREEEEPAATGWLHWIRKPALAVSMAALLVASISLFHEGKAPEPARNSPAVHASSAVADLQYLDKNNDVLQDFELLDDMPQQGAATTNP